MKSCRLLLLFFGLLTAFSLRAQPKYPQDLFRNPLAIPIRLAGNFGECRPNHFHSGIDIKTNGVENLPVHAAAAGYVSRISLKPGGFGHCLYITHPEGYTTVYAHLNDFAKPLQALVRTAQYRNENWELDTVLGPGVFPVAKGQQIAWSGNTGSSTAPHLHFEIRNTETERPLNPQLFGLTAPDSRAPVLRNLYLYNLDNSIYQTPPRKIALQKSGSSYRPAGGDTITTVASRVGIGIDGDDYADGSENTLAPLHTSLSANGAPICNITLDDIGYDETRYLHAYADYCVKQKGGPWVQLMLRLPGNNLTRIYDAPQDGIISLGASPVAVEGSWEDAAGQQSRYSFWLKNSGKSASLCTPEWVAGKPISYQSPNLRLAATAAALYDGVCETVRESPKAGALSAAFQIGRPDIPLHTSLSVWIKPDRPVPFEQRTKLALIRNDGKAESGTPAASDSERWYRGSAKAFGTFWLVADTVAPAITPVKTGGGMLRFKITDKTTSVAAVRGEADGKWLLFEQHGDIWTYVFDDRLPKGTYNLKLTATDAVGNQKTYTTRFTK